MTDEAVIHVNETPEPNEAIGAVSENAASSENPYGDIQECYLSNGTPDCHSMQADILKLQKENTDLHARNDGLRRQLTKGGTVENLFDGYENDDVLAELFPGFKDENVVSKVKAAYNDLSQEGRDSFLNVCKKIGLNQTQANTMAVFFMDTASRAKQEQEKTKQEQEKIDRANQELINSKEFEPTFKNFDTAVKYANKFCEYDNDDKEFYDKLIKDPKGIRFVEKLFLGAYAGLKEASKAAQGQSTDIAVRNGNLSSRTGINEFNYREADKEAQREFLYKARSGAVKTNLSKAQIDEELFRLCCR
jgi:hypothetical protein